MADFKRWKLVEGEGVGFPRRFSDPFPRLLQFGQVQRVRPEFAKGYVVISTDSQI